MNRTVGHKYYELSGHESGCSAYAQPFARWEAIRLKKKDQEPTGAEVSYDFGTRIYDARVGRWLSRDALEGKYASHSSYTFAINNPIAIMDPDGKDGVAVISGNKITIYSTIYVVGEGVTDEKIKAIQASITGVWGNTGGQYVDPESNKSYSIEFNIKVIKGMPSREQMLYNPGANIVKLSPDSQIPSGRSFVAGRLGHWNINPTDTDVWPHEAGHFIGLGDAYFEYHFPTWDADVTHTSNVRGESDMSIMAKRSNDGISGNSAVTQEDRDLIAGYVLAENKKTGNSTVHIPSSAVVIFDEQSKINTEERNSIIITYPKYAQSPPLQKLEADHD